MKKKIINMTLVLVFILSTAAFARASVDDETIVKPYGSDSDVQSRKIYGRGDYGNFAIRLIEGTGVGYVTLYKYKKFLIDERMATIMVGDGNKHDYKHYWLSEDPYYITLRGDKHTGLRGFISNYVN
jgi:hypothetical protein